MAEKLHELTGLEAAAKIASGDASSVELVQDCLDHIAEREDIVGAWQYLDPEYALTQARQADEAGPVGPFHGVPFGVKDVIESGDMPTEHGSEIFKDNRPEADAACIAAMRASGAVLMGKTVSTEFATYQWGKTRNPHDPERTPGGSSSGSAAAVGDKMVPIAFGNQTAGSLIRPAAFCGVHAFKPTHGTVNLAGIFELVARLDTLGYMGRSVDDLAAFYNIVRGAEEHSPLPDGIGRTPRIGLCKTHHWNEAEISAVDALESAAARLEELGAEVREFSLPDHFNDLAQTHTTILCAGLARSMKDIHQNQGNRISDQLRTMLDDGANTSAADVVTASAHADKCMVEFASITSEFDVLLTPSAPGEAPEGWATGNPIFQIVWTLLQVPCLTLPWNTGVNGMPVGIQLIGRKGNDDRVLRIGKWLDARKS